MATFSRSRQGGQSVPRCRLVRSRLMLDVAPEEGVVLSNALSSSDPASPVTHGAGGRRRRAWAVVVVVALAAAVAGVFIGRATKSGEEAGHEASWQALPAAPIVGRLGPSAVWTGTEMIVWGGYARSEDVGQASDGAAYNPTTGAWRTTAPSPSGVQGGAAVAWTGDEMVVWASNSPDGPVGAAVYDPATDSWRRLPAGPLGKRESFSSVWTGKELTVVGGNLGDTLAKPMAAALDPRPAPGASWRRSTRSRASCPPPASSGTGMKSSSWVPSARTPRRARPRSSATTRRPMHFARSISRRRRSPRSSSWR